jgi:hypothetical protein
MTARINQESTSTPEERPSGIKELYDEPVSILFQICGLVGTNPRNMSYHEWYNTPIADKPYITVLQQFELISLISQKVKLVIHTAKEGVHLLTEPWTCYYNDDVVYDMKVCTRDMENALAILLLKLLKEETITTADVTKILKR